jgi:hypothetical protein
LTSGVGHHDRPLTATPCDVARRCGAEELGAGLLAAAVIGSGIMAARLTDDVAVQLLDPMSRPVAAGNAGEQALLSRAQAC